MSGAIGGARPWRRWPHRPEALWLHPHCAESLPHALALPSLSDAQMPPKGTAA